MAGIYFHIPFCKQACHYCDFHFSTNRTYTGRMVECLVAELEQRAVYLENEPVETIYFGGGTPSLLEGPAIERLLAAVRNLHSVRAEAEITLEANPDDLSEQKLKELRAAGINRLSIGLQSFDDRLLEFLNRAHDSREAVECVRLAKQAGFTNISADLIYAIPGERADRLTEDLTRLEGLGVQHISTYCLTIEPGTAFGNWYKKGRLVPVDEERAASDYLQIMQFLRNLGFEHYEISNFALPGYLSRHNTSYWLGTRYLGVGPGAHSYDGRNRRSNISNNMHYMKGIESGNEVFENDILTDTDRMNEYILTSLRTMWGTDLNKVLADYRVDLLAEHQDYLDNLRKRDLVLLENGMLRLTDAGKLLADQIAEDLFRMPPE